MAHDDATTTINSGPDRRRAEQEGPAHDLQRPAYHFLPPANWLNDPNGLIHWQGTYHLFYQYNPNGPFWGTIEWGHATSTDLVHWTHQPIALAPTPGAYDSDGCFSGCAVDDNGVPTIIYTGVQRDEQLPCVATGDADLRTWHKYPGNPVIAAPPADLDLVGFRDHTVWKEGDTWYQGIGSGILHAGGTVLLYQSSDLRHWEYLHPLYVGDRTQLQPVWTGSMWECPDFFPLGDKHVLVVSVWDNHRTLYPIYFVGTYTDGRFTPESVQRLDFGDSFYAPQSLRDAQGRRLMWGWLREEWDAEAQLAAGWSGVMSLPRLLTLRPDSTLDMRPAPELAQLRGRHYAVPGSELTSASVDLLTRIMGDTLEIVAELEVGDASEVGLVVRCSPDQTEQTRIYYDTIDGRLAIDSTQASANAAATGGAHSGPFRLARRETLRLHIFLDRSVVEVFANERACVTSRVYPTQPDSRGLALFAQGGTARVVRLDIWELAAIWPPGFSS
jgi:beta-fructofuranosidase